MKDDYDLEEILNSPEFEKNLGLIKDDYLLRLKQLDMCRFLHRDYINYTDTISVSTLEAKVGAYEKIFPFFCS